MMIKKAKPPIYGIMAEFETQEDLIHAAEKVHQAGYRKLDAYSPFPIEELHHALHMPETKLPMIVLLGGILGAIGGYMLQYFVSVINYPLNIGGRPYHSWPAFLPVTFETTVLCAAFAAVGGMIALNGLPMPYHPVFNVQAFERASRDRFFIVIEAEDPKFDREGTKKFFESLSPVSINEVDH